MKKLLIISAFILFSIYAFAQDVPRNTISVVGSSQITMYPVAYKIRFLLQEENKLPYGKPINKTSIDSLRSLFFENLKAYGYNESDLTLIKQSSTPYNDGSNTPLNNSIYELKNVKPDVAQKLVGNLRFNGLKGAVARAQYLLISKPVQDSLYAGAIKDAHSLAANLAKQVNKSVGEAYNITTGYNNGTQRDFNIEYDTTDLYNMSRFEISLVDSKVYPLTVNVTYELKTN